MKRQISNQRSVTAFKIFEILEGNLVLSSPIWFEFAVAYSLHNLFDHEFKFINT